MGVSVLVLEDFPQPATARALSPNGRVHWAPKRIARLSVVDHVTVAALRSGLQRLRAPVTLHVVYTVPDHRHRDQDNYTTGVLKVAIDTLVRGGWLPDGDDTEHLHIEPVEVVVQKGRRALELRLEETS